MQKRKTRTRKTRRPQPKKEDPHQLCDGTWGFTVSTSPSRFGFVWSRGNGSSHIETYVSKANSALLFTADTALDLRSETFNSRAAFLAWACEQLGGGTTYVWDMTTSVATETNTCP